jgi:ADP-heptose:LPS heptosyltransferase
LYLQRCRCLEKAGFPLSRPEFHTEVRPEHLRAAEISESGKGSYFHISPFTTADYKELSPAQLAELIAALAAQFPGKRLALSCAPTPRELAKMEQLLGLLPHKPWRVFAGNLNLIQVAAVIKNSAIHFCGDTGTLHLAVMTQTPVVAWFWPNPGIKEWVSTGEKCQVIVSSNPPDTTFLRDIATDALVQGAKAVLNTKGA